MHVHIHTYVIHYCHSDMCCISDIILVEYHLHTIFFSSCNFWHKSVKAFEPIKLQDLRNSAIDDLIGEMIDSLVTGRTLYFKQCTHA